MLAILDDHETVACLQEYIAHISSDILNDVLAVSILHTPGTARSTICRAQAGARAGVS